jgi:DNA-binding MarR family transcriptional regulator/N-acetylglutamate synthase-like GNAT family acetyltransferase
MDIFQELGELALASRMKRLSDYFMREVTSVYQSQNLDFEARWFPIFYTIWKCREASIMELADLLKISHPAIIQTAKELEIKGLIQSNKCKQDQRKRLVSLSEKGEKIIPQLQVLWQAMSKVNLEILQQQKNNLLFALDEMENILTQKSHYERIMEQLKVQQIEQVEILAYQPEFKNDFKNLNYEWIEKYFKVEEADLQVLEYPEENILANGGFIFFARINQEIVGTCALLKESETTFELVKMAVKPTQQGKQIGKKLCLYAIEQARTAGAKTLVLESNTKLTPAITMYKKVGFAQVEMLGHPSPYERCNIKMRLDL